MLSLRPLLSNFPGSIRSLKPHFSRSPFSTTARIMAQEFKLKDIKSIDLKDGQMQEAEIEGMEGGKVLLLNSLGKIHATSPNCTHYGAPLKNGVLSSDGRLTCAWHGACFKVESGDVEDAPALDPIGKFEILEKDGAVFVKGEEAHIKQSRRQLNISCKAAGEEKIVVIGGGSGTIGTVEELRKCGSKAQITVLSIEPRPYDRTKLSKALLADLGTAAWRSEEFYKDAAIDIKHEEVTSIDFESKSVKTKSGQSYPYTKLVLASGGKPKSLPLPGLKEGELGNVFLLRDLSHTQAINAALGDKSKQIVVIGSSFIGMEVANNLAQQKHDVSVVGMESEPCEAVFGPKLGAVFRKILEKNGVKFHLSAGVEAAEPSSSDKKKVGAVKLKGGVTLPAEIVIEGVGVNPNTFYLNDSKGGPSLQKDGSIRVDEHFQIPSLPGVFAIGDIATYPYKGADVRIEHWNVAQNAGRQVARHLSGQKTKPFTPIFWSALGSQLRYCGHPVDGWDDLVIDGDIEVTQDKMPSFAAYFCKGDNVVAVATMMKDPIMSQSAELIRRGRMVSKADLQNSKGPMTANL